MPPQAGKTTLIHRLEYLKKGHRTFEFYMVLPRGVTYPDGERLKITDTYIGSNRGCGVRYRLRPVLISGEAEQLPPD